MNKKLLIFEIFAIVIMVSVALVSLANAITPPVGATDYMVYGTTSQTSIKYYNESGINLLPDGCFKSTGGVCVNFGQNFVFYGKITPVEEVVEPDPGVFPDLQPYVNQTIYGIAGCFIAGLFWYVILKNI